MVVRRMLLLCGTLVPLTAGCYTYRPVSVDSVPIGTPVRARINAEAAERISQDIGREERMLEGPLTSRTAEQLTLRLTVPAPPDRTGTKFTQRVLVPRASVLEVETRQLHKGRTAAVTVVGAAVVGFLLHQAFRGENAPSGDDKGGTDNRVARGIIISLPLR